MFNSKWWQFILPQFRISVDEIFRKFQYFSEEKHEICHFWPKTINKLTIKIHLRISKFAKYQNFRISNILPHKMCANFMLSRKLRLVILWLSQKNIISKKSVIVNSPTVFLPPSLITASMWSLIDFVYFHFESRKRCKYYDSFQKYHQAWKSLRTNFIKRCDEFSCSQ